MTFNAAENLIVEMLEEYNVVMQVTCFSGRLWTRIAGGIYSEREDYERLRDAVLKKFRVGK